MQEMKICVIGRGIIGLSSAYVMAKDNPNCSVHIIADDDNVCSEHSFGSIWAVTEQILNDLTSPYDGPRIIDTFEWSTKLLSKEPELAEQMGIKINKGYHVFDGTKQGILELEEPLFRKTVVDLRPATQEEIEKHGFKKNPNKYCKLFERSDVKCEDIIVYQYGMVVFDTKLYLPWYIKQLKQMEAMGEIKELKLIKHTLQSLQDVCSDKYDVVVNCSGFGAKLLCNDSCVLPIRGQYLSCNFPDTSSPSSSSWFACFDPFICPLMDRVLVGTIFQRNRADVNVDQRDTKELIADIKALWPDVEKHIISVGVGVRPGRVGGTRLEAELINKTLFIHNYGHGARGVMTHWGCAKEVSRIFHRLSAASKL